MATLSYIAEQVELSEQLAAGRSAMSEPQDLPGRFGRVIRDVNRVLAATQSTAVLAGGWAVWWHGYTARLTNDVDIVLPEDQIDDFLTAAGVAGFQVLNVPEGRWPKVQHKETDITVDILPEGKRPGTAIRPAPTLIGHPSQMGGEPARLHYIDLPTLVELKLAAGRTKDELDVMELLRAKPQCIEQIRQHLVGMHADYVKMLDILAAKAAADESR
jgi:hypothetical protein